MNLFQVVFFVVVVVVVIDGVKGGNSVVDDGKIGVEAGTVEPLRRRGSGAGGGGGEKGSFG